MKQYLCKFSLLLGFLTLSATHLQAGKIAFYYEEKDKFDVLHSLEGATQEAVGGYSEKPDVAKDALTRTPQNRLFENALNFCRLLHGSRPDSSRLFQGIYGCALKLFNAAAQEKPKTLVFLGRTPTFLKETLQRLYELDPQEGSPSLVQVAFSGSPDILSQNGNRPRASRVRNVLTPNRVKVFFQYLDSLSFDKITGEMWVVDLLASGSGLNSFLRLLRGYYLEKKMPFPDFRFWALGFPEDDADPEIKTYYFNYRKKLLSFSDQLSKFGYKPMDIPCFPLPLHPQAVTFLLDDAVAYSYGGVQEYPAWKMKGRDKNPISQETPGSDLSLFRQNILVPMVDFLHAKGTHAMDSLTLREWMDFLWKLLQDLPLEDMVHPSLRDTVLQEKIRKTCSTTPVLVERDRLLLKSKIILDIYKYKQRDLTSETIYSPPYAARLNAEKVVFHYDKDNFDVLQAFPGATKEAVGNYTEKPDVSEEHLVQPANTRLFETALHFLMPLDGENSTSRTPFQDIYGAALKLFKAAAQERPQTLVFLGRAPTFLKEMVQQLYEGGPPEDKPSLVQVAFSGCPDIKSINPGVRAFSHLRNVLTPNRVKVFFQYLDTLGFDKIMEEMWVVDLIGSGGGLNSFLRLLREYYMGKKMDFPYLRFWGLTLSEGNSESPTNTFCFDYAKEILSFSGKFSKLGYKPMDIPSVPLPLHKGTLDLMDNDWIEHFYGGVQEYLAWKMKGLDKNPVLPQTPGEDLPLFRKEILARVMPFLQEKGPQALEALTLKERFTFMMHLLHWMPMEDMVHPSTRDTILQEKIQEARLNAAPGQEEAAVVQLKAEIMMDTYRAKEKNLKGRGVYSPQGAVQKF